MGGVEGGWVEVIPVKLLGMSKFSNFGRRAPTEGCGRSVVLALVGVVVCVCVCVSVRCFTQRCVLVFVASADV